MRIERKVWIEVNRVQGKFASRDEIEDAFQEALEEAIDSIDLDGLGADGTSEYEVTDSGVDV